MKQCECGHSNAEHSLCMRAFITTHRRNGLPEGVVQETRFVTQPHVRYECSKCDCKDFK